MYVYHCRPAISSREQGLIICRGLLNYPDKRESILYAQTPPLPLPQKENTNKSDLCISLTRRATGFVGQCLGEVYVVKFVLIEWEKKKKQNRFLYRFGDIFGYQYICENRNLTTTMVIEDITKGVIPGMTVAKAVYLSECAVSCLSMQGHSSGVQMSCEGIIKTPEPLYWATPYTDQLARSTDDLQEATEHGAECISALFAIEHTSYTIVKRSRKKTGVDYWLGKKDDPLFQEAARLEVSGILNGKKNIKIRKEQKIQQTNQSDDTNLPAYVSIVEFGTPAIDFNKK